MTAVIAQPELPDRRWRPGRSPRSAGHGVVELDQSILGGQSKGKKGGSSEKAPVTIAVERTPPGRLGLVRLDG